ncbi:MAG: hypothetical protein QOJ44_340, partial [Acidimicrobiaceae bacterium]|nr:hypothetical protein [Acidimicrobiaceae bacterium]
PLVGVQVKTYLTTLNINIPFFDAEVTAMSLMPSHVRSQEFPDPCRSMKGWGRRREPSKAARPPPKPGSRKRSDVEALSDPLLYVALHGLGRVRKAVALAPVRWFLHEPF